MASASVLARQSAILRAVSEIRSWHEREKNITETWLADRRRLAGDELARETAAADEKIAGAEKILDQAKAIWIESGKRRIVESTPVPPIPPKDLLSSASPASGIDQVVDKFKAFLSDIQDVQNNRIREILSLTATLAGFLSLVSFYFAVQAGRNGVLGYFVGVGLLAVTGICLFFGLSGQRSYSYVDALEFISAAREHHRRWTATARERYERKMAEAADLYRRKSEEINTTLEQEWAKIKAKSNTFAADYAASSRDWSQPIWNAFRPVNSTSPVVRLGAMGVAAGGLRLSFPGLLPLAHSRAIMLKSRGPEKARATQALQSIMLRHLAAVPPGKLKFIFIDPVGLGQTMAPLMELADYDESLVTSRAWSDPQHIEQRLLDLTEHMETVIQKYLRNQYATIEEYNKDAGEVAEPYRVLVVAGFPVNFSETAARRLVSIAANGPRCGVYTLVTVDADQPLPYGFNLADLERTATLIEARDSTWVWQDPDYRDCTLELDGPPEAAVVDRIVRGVGEEAAKRKEIQVPFDRIALPSTRWWLASTTSKDGLSVPLGRSGAAKQRTLDLGRGTAQHALVGGKTGSGKSTLLHVLITNLATAYSPDEVELYLIDFKQGVEFQVYTDRTDPFDGRRTGFALPHARVVAIESEREFGLSVLQGLDAEMKRRGDRFREAGKDSIGAFREATGQAMARILLLVDEFQEFFVEDDTLAQQAALLLDRLVRQGRSFGIHVLLGSQTLAGAYTLPRATMDQMGVRIALQCSEADARLILSDDNPAARLLSRPGEAIYNDQNGLVEGNSPFQVVWLSEEQQMDYLARIEGLAADRRYAPPRPQIVFEGNAPADVTRNQPLAEMLALPAPAVPPRAVPAWLGEPTAIKEPTAAPFRRQSGSNLLIVGQRDEEALGMLTTALLSLAAHHDPYAVDGKAARFHVLDFTPVDAPHAGLLARVADLLPHDVRVTGRRGMPEVIAAVDAEVQRRLEADATGGPPIYLFVYGLQCARDLRQDDDLSFGSLDTDEPAAPNPAKQFPTIVREGPDHGVHTLIWCDTYANLTRTLDRRVLREFEMRVAFQMSAEDSSNLIDTPAASKLGEHRALLFSEEQGRLEKFRPYGLPPSDWLEHAAEQLRAREPTAAD